MSGMTLIRTRQRFRQAASTAATTSDCMRLCACTVADADCLLSRGGLIGQAPVVTAGSILHARFATTSLIGSPELHDTAFSLLYYAC